MSRAQSSQRRALSISPASTIVLVPGYIYQSKVSVQAVIGTVTSAQTARSSRLESIAEGSVTSPPISTRTQKNEPEGKDRPCIILGSAFVTKTDQANQSSMLTMTTLEGLSPTLSCYLHQHLLIPVNGTPPLKNADDSRRVIVEPEATWPHGNHSYVLAKIVSFGPGDRFEYYMGERGFRLQYSMIGQLLRWCSQLDDSGTWSAERDAASKASNKTRAKLMAKLRDLETRVTRRDKSGQHTGLTPDEMQEVDHLYNSHIKQIALASGDDLPAWTCFPPSSLPVGNQGSFWRLRPYFEARLRAEPFNYEYETVTKKDQDAQVQRIFAAISHLRSPPARQGNELLVQALAEVLRVAREEYELLHAAFRNKTEVGLATIVSEDKGLAAALSRLLGKPTQSWVLYPILNYLQQAM